MVQSLGIDIGLLLPRRLRRAAWRSRRFAGMIAAPVASVYPGMGNQMLIVCFVVVVIGGIGSIKGALLGVAADRACRHLRQGACCRRLRGHDRLSADGGVLLWRPAGPVRAGRRDERSAPPRGCSLLAVLGAALLLLRARRPSSIVELVAKIMIMAVFAMSLDLLVGFTGLVSLGHAAFFGLGAYALALLVARQSTAANLWLIAAGSRSRRRRCSRSSIGALVLRTRGVYFIMVTLAFAQMVYFVVPRHASSPAARDGAYIYVKPAPAIFGWMPFDLGNGRALLLRRARRCWSRTYRLPARAARARSSAVRWRASAATSSACARWASPPSATSSPLRAGRRARRARGLSSPRRSSASSIPNCSAGSSRRAC